MAGAAASVSGLCATLYGRRLGKISVNMSGSYMSKNCESIFWTNSNKNIDILQHF